MENLNAKRFEFGAVGFAAGSDEVIQSHELVATRLQERSSKRASDETTDSSDEDLHVS